jgi:hypothetical protein
MSKWGRQRMPKKIKRHIENGNDVSEIKIDGQNAWFPLRCSTRRRPPIKMDATRKAMTVRREKYWKLRSILYAPKDNAILTLYSS